LNPLVVKPQSRSVLYNSLDGMETLE